MKSFSRGLGWRSIYLVAIAVSAAGASLGACSSSGAAKAPVTAVDAGTGGGDTGPSAQDSGQGAADAGIDVQCGALVLPEDNIKPPLTGAPAYVFGIGPSARHASHTPTPNPAKTACLGCHKAGGTAKAFLVAGSVDTPSVPDGTDPPGFEILVRDDRDTLYTALADRDGNFFIPAPDVGCFAVPARGAIRTATKSTIMTNPQGTGNCNQCHGGSGLNGIVPP